MIPSGCIYLKKLAECFRLASLLIKELNATVLLLSLQDPEEQYNNIIDFESVFY